MEGTSAVGCARKMLFAVRPVSCTPGSSRRPNRTCSQQHLPKDASTFVAVEASYVCALSAKPIVVCTSVHRHLGCFGYNVHKTIPATPHMATLVPDASATRFVVGRLSDAAGLICRLSHAASLIMGAGLHRHATAVQQPSPLRMQRMLNAGGMQLCDRYEGPPRRVPIDAE